MNDHPTFVRRGLIHVPVQPPASRAGRKPGGLFFEWTPADIRHAHSLHVAGDRGLWVREGERLYQRGRKRVQRSRLSAEDMGWAEKDAVSFSWKRLEQTQRSVNLSNTT